MDHPAKKNISGRESDGNRIDLISFSSASSPATCFFDLKVTLVAGEDRVSCCILPAIEMSLSSSLGAAVPNSIFVSGHI